ncbi:MAG: hypothetical protein M5T61_19710 [Acidimicrobiia bacterium]|nr:hypothetical protein [Acidimicrobiia bacterium]
MRTRVHPRQLELDAVAALHRAAEDVGLRVERTSGTVEDLAITAPDGTTFVVEVKAASIPTLDKLRSLAATRHPGRPTVVVADQLSPPARELLDATGIGWLDRRGHLRLVAEGLYVDSDTTPIRRREETPESTRPVVGRSGLAAAAALLMDPDDPMRGSDIARTARLNPSSITRAMSALVAGHLAERRGRGDYRPIVPDLFWALADEWPRDGTSIRWAIPPEDDDQLGFNRGDLSAPGWAAAGVSGALAWGAPLAATADYPVTLYVPDAQLVRRAQILHGEGTGDEARLSVDPIGLITSRRFDGGTLVWPLAHPLFCALDLTGSARDREALEQWTPSGDFTRVW